MRYFTCANIVGIQFLLLLGSMNLAHAQSIDATTFNNNQQQQRYQRLINEIRCPVCQGQSIGGSNAGLAKDLRQQVQNMIVKGSDDSEIVKFMVARYGDFVVFKPPVNKATYLLWFAPFAFLILGLFLFIRTLSRKSDTVAQKIDTTKAKELLK